VRVIHDTGGTHSLGVLPASSPARKLVAQRTGTLFVETDHAERRKFTIAELKRICSFPDDYVMTGSYAQQWARLGNSVPPLMAQAIAACVRDILLAVQAAA
jgi:DNA (cytosine-5)-methyltransferase 1